LIFGSVTTSQGAIVLKAKERSPRKFRNIRRLVKKIKGPYLEELIHKFISSTRPSRIIGSKGHSKVIPFLNDFVRGISSIGKSDGVVETFNPDITSAILKYKNDFKKEIQGKYPRSHPVYKKWKLFTDKIINTLKKLQGIRGKNFVWEKRGTIDPDSILILGANYDTILQNKKNNLLITHGEMPGADDNASGCIILMALIEILSELNLPKTVRIVFFDYQEFGQLGAKAYVKKHRNELVGNKKFAGFINLLMLGNDTKEADKLKRSGNMKAYSRRQGTKGFYLDRRLYNGFNYGGSKVTRAVKFDLFPNGFEMSDHKFFWEAGLPALVLSQDWENDLNQRQHTSSDFVETLNMKTLYRSFQYISGAVIAWAFDIRK